MKQNTQTATRRIIKAAIYKFVLCWFLLFFASFTHGSNNIPNFPTSLNNQPTLLKGNLLYIPIPPDVSKEEIIHPGEILKTHLYTYLRERLGLRNGATQEQEKVDLIIIFIDKEGNPILPDLDNAKKRQSDAYFIEQAEAPENELSFMFNSPLYPWSGEELSILNNAFNDFYPIAKTIYGEPAFNITVNVLKDPTIPYGGLYFPGTNEIVLPGANLDALCHEMIHAFRDDNIIGLNSFEEGMTRAAEVEIFNRLDGYTHWDEYHSYALDKYYEGLNKQVIGSHNGNFTSAYPNTFMLLRYQLSGYAWAKALIEDPTFFVDFNKELYDRTLSDPTTTSSESKLLEIASSLKPTVEGKQFLIWYSLQGVLNTNPENGYFLYQRINQFVIDCFYRDYYGETMQSNQTIEWEVYDYRNMLWGSGSDITTSYGWITYGEGFYEILPQGYAGRIKVVATTESPNGLISDTSLRSIRNEIGIFGIVKDFDLGTVTITPLDDSTPPATLDLVNGAFSVPSLKSVRGRFVVVFTDINGQTLSKSFTKDGSDYFLIIDEGDSVADLEVTTTDSPDPVLAGSELIYTITASNKGPDNANDVIVSDMLPVIATVVSAITSKGACSQAGSKVTCNIGEMANGETVTVTISIKAPDTAGPISNTVMASYTTSDPDYSNNVTTEDTTVIVPVFYYCDNDNDGYKSKSVSGTCIGTDCVPPGCQSTPGSDCNDDDPTVYPNVSEGSCADDIDNDCDGFTDISDTDCSIVPQITLYRPNGKEIIPSGSNYMIVWGAPVKAVKFKVKYSLDNGLSWILRPDAENISGTSYNWPVPEPLGNKKKCLVKVIGYKANGVKVGADKSVAPFAIEVVKLISPNGDPGDSPLISGDTYPITWTTNATKRDVAKVKLYYTKNGGVTWDVIYTIKGSNPGTYSWTAPPVGKEKTNCKVKVELKDESGNVLGKDASDNYFTIQPTPQP